MIDELNPERSKRWSSKNIQIGAREHKETKRDLSGIFPFNQQSETTRIYSMM